MSKYYDGTTHVFYSEVGNTTRITAKPGQTLIVDGTLPAIGNDNEIIYNNEGALVSSANLIFDANRLTTVTETITSDEQSTSGGVGALRVSAGGLYVHKSIFSNGSVIGANIYGNSFSKTSSIQSIPNATETLLDSGYWTSGTISGGVYDTTKMTYSNGLYTIGLTGNYLVSYNVGFSANAVGIRRSYIGIAGQKYAHSSTNALTSGGTALTGSYVLKCSAGEQVGIYVYQDSGGSLVMEGTAIRGFFSVLRL